MYLLYQDEDFTHLQTDKGDLFLKYLFDKYYGELCILSFKYVGRTDIAEDIVQDVFINIWKKRQTLNYVGGIKPCLITSVINTSINYIKSKFAKQTMLDVSTIKHNIQNYNQHDELVTQELHYLIKIAMEQLPDRCRCIFTLSRFSGLSNKEIAEELSISIKTVESQMGIALKRVKQFLIKFGYFISLFPLSTNISFH